MGAGAGAFGYGQALNSSAVAEGTKLTVTHITQLRNDIINAWTHIFGTAPTPATVVEHGTVRFNVTDAPVDSYTAIANTINTNRFTVAGSQSAAAVPAVPSVSQWPGIYGADWTSLIQCTITAVWPTPDQARHFWNSGGLIRITASRSGGSSTSQNTQWNAILSSAATQSFGGALPAAGVPPTVSNNAQNWYRCTNSRQIWYSTSGSSPYGANSYRIYARTLDAVGGNNSTGTARQGEWHIEFVDNYVDPGQNPLNPQPDTVDSVDGVFSVSVSLLYATGILVPLGLGNFSVTLPSVTISAIAPP